MSGTDKELPEDNNMDSHHDDEPADNDEQERTPGSESTKSRLNDRETVRRYTAYTIKLPQDQLSALQSIWLELKRLYGTHSPDKSGMIEAAISSWLKRWESADREALLNELLEIKENTRRRQYKKDK